MLERVDTARAAEFYKQRRFQVGELRRQVIRDRMFRDFDEDKGRLPDYIGVGVQRAGTSRLHSLLTAHPDVAEVYDPAWRVVKEIHWFDRPLIEDSEERDKAYASWFPAHETRLMGEWTPRYLYDLWPIDRIQALCPDIKLLILLREPVSRLRSVIQFYSQRGVTLNRDALRESMWRGMYGAQLEYVFERFSRDQVFVGLYEQCNVAPAEELVRLYKFLGLDTSFTPEGLDRRVNSSAKLDINSTLLSSAESLYRGDRDKLARVLPDVDFSIWD